MIIYKCVHTIGSSSSYKNSVKSLRAFWPNLQHFKNSKVFFIEILLPVRCRSVNLEYELDIVPSEVHPLAKSMFIDNGSSGNDRSLLQSLMSSVSNR